MNRLRLKILGLCALVLGAMTFATTTAAQAEKGARWMVKGSNIENESLKPLLQSTAENGEVLLLATIGGTPIKVLCKTMGLVNFRLIGEGSLSEGKVRFSECVTLIKEAIVKACAPKTGGVIGLIESGAGPALFVLAGGAGAILFKPSKSEFFTIFETSEECALFESVKIEGELVLKDCQNKFKTEQVTHLLEADTSSTLTVLGKPAALDGSLNVTLAGEHTGLQWSGLPA